MLTTSSSRSFGGAWRTRDGGKTWTWAMACVTLCTGGQLNPGFRNLQRTFCDSNPMCLWTQHCGLEVDRSRERNEITARD